MVHRERWRVRTLRRPACLAGLQEGLGCDQLQVRLDAGTSAGRAAQVPPHAHRPVLASLTAGGWAPGGEGPHLPTDGAALVQARLHLCLP